MMIEHADGCKVIMDGHCTCKPEPAGRANLQQITATTAQGNVYLKNVVARAKEQGHADQPGWQCFHPDCAGDRITGAPCKQGRPTCKGSILVYLDGKAEYEWACELPMLHEGPHKEGRYGWQ